MSVKDKTSVNLGSSQARLVLYLPNPPQMHPSMALESPDVAQIIEDNGNHWRKILTILAKINCRKHKWQSYRDEYLLQQREMICFDDSLLAERQWHLVGGKASWLRLGFDYRQFTSLDQQGRAWHRGNVLLLPYPDYRQLPNALIDEVVRFTSR